eukprot:2350582-Amphidinium_carterae.1
MPVSRPRRSSRWRPLRHKGPELNPICLSGQLHPRRTIVHGALQPCWSGTKTTCAKSQIAYGT